VELPKRGVTILGEVKVPKSIVFPKERANIFETLAAVGYTTEFADLTRVKVYRESANGTRQLAHLNLQDKAFFESPFFYPEPDDVIFVPSSDEKRLRNTGQTYAQFATIVLAVTSLIVSVVSLTN
jgi:polysaccharide export outer membrane protein